MEEKKRIFVTQSSLPPYEEYIQVIRPLWESHWLTNMGELHKRFEQELVEYLDVGSLSLMVNGHMALELAIQMFDFPEGGEVITTPFTFISTIHAIVRNRLTPVFCDIKKTDGTIDEDKIEQLITEKTIAILPVHVYGNVCNVDKINEIANRYGIRVIYDAAHAFGVKLNGIGIGNYGDASVFSFHATKVFHSIEGGAVAIRDSLFYDKLYNLKNFGIRGEELVVGVGCNAKMNEFAAAMGICNLKYMDGAIKKRKRIDDLYRSKLNDVKGIRLLQQGENVTHNYSYFPIVVENEYKTTRDELYSILRKENIFPRKYFYPLATEQECYRGLFQNKKIDIAKDMSLRILTLPIYENLEEEEVLRIVDIISGAGNGIE